MNITRKYRLMEKLAAAQRTKLAKPLMFMGRGELHSERRRLKIEILRPKLGAAAAGGAIGALAGSVLGGKLSKKLLPAAAIGGALGALALPQLKRSVAKIDLRRVEGRLHGVSRKGLGL